MNAPSLYRQRHGRRLRPFGEFLEGGLERRLGGGAQRRVIDLGLSQMRQAVVGSLAEVEDVQPRLEQRDEGQEAFALQTLLVEPVGFEVRGGDDDDAELE